MNSPRRAFKAASQSKGDTTVDLALKGDRMGELTWLALESAGDAGIFRLGKVVGPMAGADIG